MRLRRTFAGSVAAGAVVAGGGLAAQVRFGSTTGAIVSVALILPAIVGALLWINR